MRTEITIKLKKGTIEKARAYAKSKNVSLSQVLSNILSKLPDVTKKTKQNPYIPL